MTTRDDLDKITRSWGQMMADAVAIHNRDEHAERFESCYEPLCRMVMVSGNVILQQELRIREHNRPFLVQRRMVNQ